MELLKFLEISVNNRTILKYKSASIIEDFAPDLTRFEVPIWYVNNEVSVLPTVPKKSSLSSETILTLLPILVNTSFFLINHF